MANTLVTLKTIARQALPCLIDNLVFPNLCHRDFSEELHDVGDTVRVRRPTVFTAQEFDAEAGVDFQDMNEDAIDVVLDHIATVDARASAIETATGVADLNRVFIEPAAARSPKRSIAMASPSTPTCPTPSEPPEPRRPTSRTCPRCAARSTSTARRWSAASPCGIPRRTPSSRSCRRWSTLRSPAPSPRCARAASGASTALTTTCRRASGTMPAG